MPSTTTPCALCGAASYQTLHDMGWRRILRCRQCRLVRADPLPTAEQKLVTETKDYEVDVNCPEVHDMFANYHRDFVEDPIIRRMRRHLAELEEVLGGPRAVLDIGVGTGIFLHLARERGWDPYGVELCAERATEAIREFEVPVAIGPFEEQHFDGRRFQAMTMLDVLEHVPDPLAMLRRAHAVLQPGGALFVSVPNEASLLTVLVGLYARAGGPSAAKLLARLYVPVHLHYFTPRTLPRLLTAAGFRVHRVHGAPVYLGRYAIPLWMRLPLTGVLAVGTGVGMSPRIEVMAIKDATRGAGDARGSQPAAAGQSEA
jgi:2-polyprenyl-3-methyl-5-hydroxy-6-metoxy-1,4-benzoquinol methylase